MTDFKIRSSSTGQNLEKIIFSNVYSNVYEIALNR